jgi:hypothetical protein
MGCDVIKFDSGAENGKFPMFENQNSFHNPQIHPQLSLTICVRPLYRLAAHPRQGICPRSTTSLFVNHHNQSKINLQWQIQAREKEHRAPGEMVVVARGVRFVVFFVLLAENFGAIGHVGLFVARDIFGVAIDDRSGLLYLSRRYLEIADSFFTITRTFEVILLPTISRSDNSPGRHE